MLFSRKIPLVLAISSLLYLAACTQEVPAPAEVNTVITEEHFVLPPLPDTVFFCGEAILIDDFDRKERLDRELLINSYYHSSTILSFKRANRYFPQIEKELKKQGIPEDFKYLCLIESGLAQATSPAGAKGFWQFMPETAAEFSLRVDREVDERLHIAKSTIAACIYLKRAYAKFKDWTLVAASYNMGMGGVSSTLELQEMENYFDLHLNNETSRYVFRILAMKQIFENQEAYGFHTKELELYEPIFTRQVELLESTDNLAHWAVEQGSTFRMLKLLNPWILGNKLTVRQDTLIIDLPK